MRPLSFFTGLSQMQIQAQDIDWLGHDSYHPRQAVQRKATG